MTENDQSPLVKAVLALDSYLSELERLGAKINSMELKSEFDFAHAQRLMSRFAECGEGVSAEIVNLSVHLGDVRARAEATAQGVADRAELVSARKTEQQKKLDEFRILGEKVRDLNTAMSELKQPPGEVLSDQDRSQLVKRLAEFEGQLSPLIEEAQKLRQDAHSAKMRTLEQNADSLTQTLQAVHQKLGTLTAH